MILDPNNPPDEIPWDSIPQTPQQPAPKEISWAEVEAMNKPPATQPQKYVPQPLGPWKKESGIPQGMWNSMVERQNQTTPSVWETKYPVPTDETDKTRYPVETDEAYTEKQNQKAAIISRLTIPGKSWSDEEGKLFQSLPKEDQNTVRLMGDPALYGRFIASELSGKPEFEKLSPEQKQAKLIDIVRQHFDGADYAKNPKYSFTKEDDQALTDKMKIDFSRGSMASFGTNVYQKLEDFKDNVTGLIGGSGPSQDININPNNWGSNLAGRMVGGAPAIAASLIHPALGAAAMGGEAAGSGVVEGRRAGFNKEQIVGLAAERGIVGALMGTLPTGSTVLKGAVGGGLETALKMAGLSLGGAAFEDELKHELGLTNPSDYSTFIETAKSPDTYANAALFGVVHGLVTKLKTEPEKAAAEASNLERFKNAGGTFEKLEGVAGKDYHELPLKDETGKDVTGYMVMPKEKLSPQGEAHLRLAKEASAKGETPEPVAQVTPAAKAPIPQIDESSPLDVSEIGGGYSRKSYLEDLQKNGGLKPEEAKANLDVTDAVAKTWAAITGRHPEEWYPEHLDGLDKASSRELAASNPNTRANVKWDSESGRALVKAMNNPDVSSFLHEGSHVVKRMLREVDPKTHEEIDNWLESALSRDKNLGRRVTDSKDLGVQKEELFARTYERYFREGKAPTPELQSAFQKMKSWLLNIYKNITNPKNKQSYSKELNVPINDQFRRILNSWLSQDPQVIERAKGVQFGKEKTTNQTEPTPLKDPTRPSLTPELKRASPRYGFGDKQYVLNFESDVDKALYIVGRTLKDKYSGSPSKSKDHSAYEYFLKNKVGMSDSEISYQGTKIRGIIKELARGADEAKVLQIPETELSKGALYNKNKTEFNRGLPGPETGLMQEKPNPLEDRFAKQKGEYTTSQREAMEKVFRDPEAKALTERMREAYKIARDGNRRESLPLWKEAQKEYAVYRENKGQLTSDMQHVKSYLDDMVQSHEPLGREDVTDGPLEQRKTKDEESDFPGTRYSDINSERKARGLKEFVPQGNPKKIKEILQEAEDTYTPEKAQSIVDDINTSHRAMTPEERGLVFVHKEANQRSFNDLNSRFLRNKDPKKGREMEGQLRENQRQFNDITRALAMANHDAAQSLVFARMKAKEDWYTSQGILGRIESTTGKAPSVEAERSIREMAGGLKELNLKKAQLDADLGGKLDALDQKARKLGYTLADVIKRAEDSKGRFVTTPELANLKLLVDQYDKLKTGAGTSRIDYLIAKQMNRIDEKVSSMKPRTLMGYLGEPGNLARTVATSYDLSAPGRQGIGLVFSHPILAAKAIPKMFGAISDFNAFKYDQELKTRGNYHYYEDTNLLSSLEGYGHEEESFHSILAKHLPGVPASQRAYTTFLNQLRADVFDSLAGNYAKGSPTAEQAAAISNFVKVFSGKGDLGNHQKALETMNLVFWAPKLIASRFQMLLGQPLVKSIRTADPFTTKLVAKEYGRTLVGAATVIGLAAAAGFKVETDPRSANFLKIQIGNTKIDVLGGLSQLTVLGSRLATGKTKTQSGIVEPAKDTLTTFLRTKLSPLVGTATDVYTGSNVVGDKTTNADSPDFTQRNVVGGAAEFGKSAIPMTFKDVYDAMQEQGMEKGAALGILSSFGLGVQSYHPTIDDQLKDLPGDKNQPLEDALLKLQQFKIDHPEIPQTSTVGGPPEKKEFSATMRRVEELTRRGVDPTSLLVKELDVPAGDKLGIASSLSARAKLTDLTPELKKELKNQIGETQYNLLQSNDDLLNAWAGQYKIADEISQFKGAGAAKAFLKSPSAELIKARLRVAVAERQAREREDEIMTKLRSKQ